MGLLNQKVKLKWNSKIKKYYESLGYTYTKMKDEFEVKIEDLQNGSGVLVNIKCDCIKCKSPYLKPMMYKDYLRWVKKDGSYYCNRCSKELYANKNTQATRLRKSISFEKWCLNNKKNDVLERWDYKLNKISPNDISYNSHGIKNKGYWFKCNINPDHISELKNINNYVCGHQDSITCKQCNSIKNNHPEFLKFFVDINDANNLTPYSSKKVLVKCPECGYIKKMVVSSLFIQGVGCPRCGDGISYPEKIVFNMLEQLGIDFEKEKVFNWSNRKRYDFYIPIKDCIIEAHGAQHYTESSFNSTWLSLQEQMCNDKLKEDMAINNNIREYIIIDCRYSDLEFIKKNILESNLSNIFNISQINWEQCEKFACGNLVKCICDLWNNKFKNTSQIAKVLKLSSNSIRIYLKKGSKLGWCDYKPVTGKHLPNDFSEVLNNV